MSAAQTIQFYGEKNPHGEFSNFYPAPITIDGVTWPTNEHYFQGKKFESLPYEMTICKAATAAMAKTMGRSRAVPLRADWEQVKDDIMRKAVLAKFTQHAALRRVLLETGTARLVEHTGRDRYWADGGNGSGKNMLGQILMEVRSQLQAGGSGSAAAVAADAVDADSEPAAKRAAPPPKSGSIEYIAGDLLECKEQYIAQQCNTTSTKALGLSKSLFQKFPHADVYTKAGTPRVPGQISVHGPPGRAVINMYGQVKPGKGTAKGPDSVAARRGFFNASLAQIAAIPGLTSIAFPFQIGCGLAGGSWEHYLADLEAFAQSVPHVRVCICRL